MESPPTAPGAGQLVADRYRLAHLLGAGAMGAVFAVTDEQTGASRAIKVIHPHVARTGVNAERFRREVTLAQQVGHPGIVRVFDAGEDPGVGLFLVMELLSGVTLRPPLSQGELMVAQALEVVTATLDPLAAAHRLQIVHRDLKPDNIFLHVPDGEAPQVKLLDFGVARQRDAAGLTSTNTGVGTPHFMAPEQATDARSVTPASDVWSAGVIMYYVLSGALPFDGEGPYETVLRACTTDHVPLDRRAPDVDYRLVDIVETCLEKDPQARFQDAGELLEVLAPIVHEPTLVEALSKRVAAEPRPDAQRWSQPLPGATPDSGASLEPRAFRATVRATRAEEAPSLRDHASSGRDAIAANGALTGPRPEAGGWWRWSIGFAAALALAVAVVAGIQGLRNTIVAESLVTDPTYTPPALPEPLPPAKTAASDGVAAMRAGPKAGLPSLQTSNGPDRPAAATRPRRARAVVRARASTPTRDKTTPAPSGPTAVAGPAGAKALPAAPATAALSRPSSSVRPIKPAPVGTHPPPPAAMNATAGDRRPPVVAGRAAPAATSERSSAPTKSNAASASAVSSAVVAAPNVRPGAPKVGSPPGPGSASTRSLRSAGTSTTAAPTRVVKRVVKARPPPVKPRTTKKQTAETVEPDFVTF